MAQPAPSTPAPTPAPPAVSAAPAGGAVAAVVAAPVVAPVATESKTETKTAVVKKQKNPYWQVAAPFALGGLSGMIATSVIQPLDMIKVRIQLLGEGGKAAKGSANPFTLGYRVISQEGFLSLYTGLSAGLLRQATYTTARLGLFRSISNTWEEQQAKKLAFWQKSVAGLAAGGLGSIFGTPADVSLIRMQADATLPAAERRNYKGVVDALVRITREEGMKGLFSGNTPVVLRAMALNLGMLATHDQALESLKPYVANGALLSFYAKAISGFSASFLSLPFDFVKTRLQKQKRKPDGSLPYNGVADCVLKVAKQEGPGAFYRGFWTYYVRIAPHAMITLWALDHLNAATKDW